MKNIYVSVQNCTLLILFTSCYLYRIIFKHRSSLKTLHRSLFFSGNIHNIQFEMRSIIDRTLLLQRPNMLLEKRVDAKVQVDLEHNAEKISITTTKPYSFEKESKNGTTTIIPTIDEKHSTNTSNIKNIGPKMDDKIIEVAEKQQIPWFAGCEYQCLYDYCGTMFFYNQDLRSHIKKEHEDPDFYLDKYKVFETKAENIACKECNLEIKRNFSSVFGHLRDHHDGMTIEDYQKKHKMKEYVKNYTVSKRLKFESQASLNDNTNGCHTPSSSNVELPSPKSSKIVPPSKIFNSSALDFDPPKDQPWYNGQEYQCQICQKLYYEVNKLLFHIRNSHNLTGKPYQKKFGKFETKKAFYICKLCFNKVKHTKNGIQNHLMQDHDGMGINSYQEVFHPDAKQLANNAKLAPNGKYISSTTGNQTFESVLNMSFLYISLFIFLALMMTKKILVQLSCKTFLHELSIYCYYLRYPTFLPNKN